MKRATITIPDDLEADLNAFMAMQDAPLSLTRLVQAALRRFLAEKGRERALAERDYRPPRKQLRITPARRASGSSDVSVEHDRVLAEGA